MRKGFDVCCSTFSASSEGKYNIYFIDYVNIYNSEFILMCTTFSEYLYIVHLNKIVKLIHEAMMNIKTNEKEIKILKKHISIIKKNEDYEEVKKRFIELINKRDPTKYIACKMDHSHCRRFGYSCTSVVETFNAKIIMEKRHELNTLIYEMIHKESKVMKTMNEEVEKKDYCGEVRNQVIFCLLCEIHCKKSSSSLYVIYVKPTNNLSVKNMEFFSLTNEKLSLENDIFTHNKLR